MKLASHFQLGAITTAQFFVTLPAFADGSVQPDCLSVWFDRASPFGVGTLGALLTYWLTARHERLKADERRKAERLELAVALTAELQSVRQAVQSRLDILQQLIESRMNGGSKIDTKALSELYRANLHRLGILGVDAVRSVVVAYKTVETIPSSFCLSLGSPGTKIENYDNFVCGHDAPELSSLREGHAKMIRLIDEALEVLRR